MAFLNRTFNAADLPQANTYEPLPEGWYAVSVKSCELSRTKAGDGEYFKMAYTVTGPSHQGRVVFGNINIENPSAKAMEIGLRDLNALMAACGIVSLTDTDQFIGCNIEIKLVIKTQPGYEPNNEIRGYRAIKGSAMPTAPANAPTHTPAPAGLPKAPWAK
jgi:hypothetical protein